MPKILSVILTTSPFATCQTTLEPVPIQTNKDIMSDMIIKNERKKYASDLTDSQWEIIKPLLPKTGNKSKWKKREGIANIAYIYAIPPNYKN